MEAREGGVRGGEYGGGGVSVRIPSDGKPLEGCVGVSRSLR